MNGQGLNYGPFEGRSASPRHPAAIEASALLTDKEWDGGKILGPSDLVVSKMVSDALQAYEEARRVSSNANRAAQIAESDLDYKIKNLEAAVSIAKIADKEADQSKRATEGLVQ